MKKHILSLMTALLLLMILSATIASAYTVGDIDGKDGITAADARLALRAAVKLDTLNEQQTKAADAKMDGKITSDDARLILRASVGLEKLHVHSYKGEVTKAATCSAKGVKTYKCSCNDSYTEEIPKTAHVYDAKIEYIKDATCIKEGEIKVFCKCGASTIQATPKAAHICDIEITKQPSAGSYGSADFICNGCPYRETIKLCTHTAKSISVDKVTKCSTSGCQGQFPSFNYMTNSLKAEGTRDFFSGFTKSTTVTQKAKATEKNFWYWGLAQTFQNMLNSGLTVGSEETYSSFVNNRFIAKNTFLVNSKSFVSDLKEGEIKSISITKMNGVDFVKNLPSSYKVTSSGSTVDLSKIKASQIGEVYKVSIALPQEKISASNLKAKTSPIERIYDADYNIDLRWMLDELNGTLDSIPAEFKNFLSVDTTAITTFSVDYYFTTDTFAPVCATYYLDISTDLEMDLYINDDGGKEKEPTVAISVKGSDTQQSYYFFNDHFTI